MFNNGQTIDVTVSPTGGGGTVDALYGYPPLHHSITACGRTEVAQIIGNCLLKDVVYEIDLPR